MRNVTVIVVMITYDEEKLLSKTRVPKLYFPTIPLPKIEKVLCAEWVKACLNTL